MYVCIYIRNRQIRLSARVSHYTLLSISFQSNARYIIYGIVLKEKLDIRKDRIGDSPVFSNSVFGVSGRLMISMSCVKINGIYALVSGPTKDK